MSEHPATAYLHQQATFAMMYDPLLDELTYLYDQLTECNFSQRLVETLVLDRWNRHWSLVEHIQANQQRT